MEASNKCEEAPNIQKNVDFCTKILAKYLPLKKSGNFWQKSHEGNVCVVSQAG